MLAYAWAHIPLESGWRAPARPLLLLVALALAIRVVFLVLLPAPDVNAETELSTEAEQVFDLFSQGITNERLINRAGDVRFDTASFEITADLVLDGKDVYAETTRHPYLPFHMYWFALSAKLDDWFGVDFSSSMRWPNILADLGILALIYVGSIKLGRSLSEAFWLGFLWAVHPISVFTSVLHGQFDSVAAFLALLAWYILRFTPGWRGALLGGMALGFAVLDKTWPALFIPCFFMIPAGWRHRTLYLGAIAVVPAFFFLLYDLSFGTSVNLVRDRVFEYESILGRYGYTYAFAHYLKDIAPPPADWLPFVAAHGRTILLATLAIVAAIVVPRRDPLVSATALIATFYAATHGFGSQYLIWIVPFALMSRQIFMLNLYSSAAIASLFLYYWAACGLQCPGHLSETREFWPLQLVWPVAIFWMFREVLLAIPFRPAFASPQRGPHGPTAAE
ncbi:MAG: hypothetical protein WEE64_16740 [Dehalococcoidia bacterium]